MANLRKTTDSDSVLKRENIRKLHLQNKRYLTLKNNNISTQEIININNLIYKKVSEKLINNSSGVVLDGFGYFCIWRTPEKIKVRNLFKGNKEEFFFNPHSNGLMYFPTLFTDVFKSSILRGWSLDGSFNKKIKSSISLKIKNGFKYKLLYSTVKSMNLKYNNKNNRKLIKNKK